MRYGKMGGEKDLATLHYNAKIKLSENPLGEYECLVNGKPALNWVIERQCMEIVNYCGMMDDAKLWATEAVGDAACPLKLFQRVCTVSLEIMKIMQALTRLEIAVGGKLQLREAQSPCMPVAGAGLRLPMLRLSPAMLWAWATPSRCCMLSRFAMAEL